ncbi:MAG: LPS export ABC transporter periplasmic protein LptC [Tunicatimonas sp.]
MSYRWFIGLGMLLLAASCRDEQTSAEEFKEYEGPTLEVTDAEFLFSDSAVVKNKITAQRQLQYANGNLDFPEGIYIESYGDGGAVTSTIVADRGSYSQEENEFTAEGNVVVKNIESGETLKTEILHWNRNDKQVHTDRYVEIISQEEVIMGEGLTAEEDMSSYRILKPTGSFSVN